MEFNFEEFVLKMRPEKPKVLAVAAAADSSVLGAVIRAYQLGFIIPILCGNKDDIENVANDLSLDISGIEIVETSTAQESAAMAVDLVRSGRADILMKGMLQTADLLRAVLNRETGIRGDGILSLVSVLYSPTRSRTLFLTDVGMVMYPDLATKVELIKNIVKFALKFGIKNPKVAPLAAVEVVNPAMQATVDADALMKMNQDGLIKDCIISGPLAFDVAVSKTAAKKKGITAPIAGDADILLFHNIEAGNSTLKAMTHFSDFLFGGIVVGATAPIVVTSRSDTEMSKLYSIACACMG